MALKEKTLFDEKDRIKLALKKLKTFEPRDGYYVAFSGGKDSVVIYDLVKRAGVKHDVHYNVTTLDPPELVQFIKREYPEVEFHRPEKSMWELIPKKLFPPTRQVRYCCEYLKERGGEDRFVITGVRAKESYSRANNRQQLESCNRTPGKMYFHPIFDWSEADVWEYIEKK